MRSFRLRLRTFYFERGKIMRKIIALLLFMLLMLGLCACGAAADIAEEVPAAAENVPTGNETAALPATHDDAAAGSNEASAPVMANAAEQAASAPAESASASAAATVPASAYGDDEMVLLSAGSSFRFYDAQGRLYFLRDASGGNTSETELVYDDVGRVIEVIGQSKSYSHNDVDGTLNVFVSQTSHEIVYEGSEPVMVYRHTKDENGEMNLESDGVYRLGEDARLADEDEKYFYSYMKELFYAACEEFNPALNDSDIFVVPFCAYYDDAENFYNTKTADNFSFCVICFIQFDDNMIPHFIMFGSCDDGNIQYVQFCDKFGNMIYNSLQIGLEIENVYELDYHYDNKGRLTYFTSKLTHCVGDQVTESEIGPVYYTYVPLSEYYAKYSAEPEPVAINAETFPDSRLRAYVIENFDLNKDLILDVEELYMAVYINLHHEDVESLTGIEYLPYLQELDVSYYNHLTMLDLSHNYRLVSVDCGMNYGLSTLILPESRALRILNCSYNDLPYLDTSSCPMLKRLNCTGIEMNELDVSHNTMLTSLSCGEMGLHKLNLTGLVNLEELNCRNNSLTELDISSCTEMKMIDCSLNSLSDLDISCCPQLQTLKCQENNIAVIDASNCPLLTTINSDDYVVVIS